MRYRQLFLYQQRFNFSASNKGEGQVGECKSDFGEKQPEGQEVSYTFDSDQIKGVRRNKEGLLLMMFTCNVCQTKQARTFSKDAYNHGVVLIRCQGCDNLHLIADNLGWFRDENVNIEQLMKEKGQQVHKFVTNEAMEFMMEEDREKLAQSKQEGVHEHHHHDGCCGHDHDHEHHHHHHHDEHKHEHHEGCCDHEHDDNHAHHKHTHSDKSEKNTK